tara:strand:- start:25 stop:327 length:303 start_codon:yes stop_codon:yes gene_type:complete
MTRYYEVQEGCQCLGHDNLPIAEAGEVVALETDSVFINIRREATATIRRSGGMTAFVEVSKPKKSKKKKGSYKTREMTPEPEPAPAPETETPEPDETATD